MKLVCIVVLSILLCKNSKAQLAIINDSDGYTNVREVGSMTSKITGRIFLGDIFLYVQVDTNKQWTAISYSPDLETLEQSKKDYYFNVLHWNNKKLHIQGYIHNSRLIPISTLKCILKDSIHRNFTKNKLTIKNDSIELIVVISPFKIGDHQIEKDKNGFVKKIDGSLPKGIDGEIPKVQIDSVNLIVNKEKIVIPTKYYKDLYEPRINSLNIYFDDKQNIYLYMPDNSDGAANYSVAWLFKKGQFVKRYVDSF